MRKVTYLAFILLVVFIPSKAQDEEYRLREPSAEEYVDRIDEILQRAEITHYVSQYQDALVAASAITDEVNWRFLDQNYLTYSQLGAIYRSFITSEQPFKTPPHELWMPEIIRLWLRENPTILDTTRLLEFEDFIIEAEPIEDLSGAYRNWRWGYLFHVIKPTIYQSNYVAVWSDGEYIFPKLPARMDSKPLRSGDFNADGDPDIAYLHSAHIGNSYNSGSLIIATLRDDNQFELTARLDYFQGGYEFPPSRYNWWFIPIGEGQKVGLIQSQNLGTNWHCTFVQVKVFEWNNDNQLVNQSTENIYPDTFTCLVLQAEKSTWSHDYNTAVEFYEQAFEIGTPTEDLMPYAQIRLGLLYLLTEQTEQAEETFSELTASESDFVQTVLETYEQDPRALPVCQAMYKYVIEGEERLQGTGTMETNSGGFNRFEAGLGYFNLENAACDLAFNLNVQLNSMSFTTNETPLTQIEALGLDVAEAIETDFDMDGHTEWLIWINAPGVDPLFFSYIGDSYKLTRPRGSSIIYWDPDQDLRQPTEYNQYHMIVLPNGVERALVNVDFDLDDYAVINCAGMCGGGGIKTCAYGNTSAPRLLGDLTLWRMQNGELLNMVFTPLCELNSIATLFPPEREFLELHAATYIDRDPYDDIVEAVPIVFSWSEEAQTYVLSPQAESTSTPILATPTAVPTQEPRHTLNEYSFNQVRSAFINKNYDAVIHITESALSSATDENTISFEGAFRYYRALALESLNQPNEALAEYVAIYEAEPDSAWGMLAGLHIEVVGSD